MTCWRRTLFFAAIGLVGLSALVRTSRAAQVFAFTEHDLDRHTRPVTDGGVVDINSTLDIHVDLEAINREAGSPTDSLTNVTHLLEPLLTLQAGVDGMATELTTLGNELAAWSAGAREPADAARLREALRRVARPTVSLLEATAGTPFEARLNEALENAPRGSIAQDYALVFSTLDTEIQTLRTRRDRLAATHGISVRAGAWLRGEASETPVHLEGFDRYPQGDEVLVPRWRIALDDGERRQLRSAVETAKALNNGQLGALLGTQASGAMRRLAELTEPCTTSLDEMLAKVVQQLGQSEEGVRAAAADALEKVRRLQSMTRTVRNRYVGHSSGGEGAEQLLLETNDNLSALASGSQDLLASIQRLQRAVAQAATDAAHRPILQPIVDWKPDSCTAALTRVQEVARALAQQCLGALGLRGRNTALLTFGEEVLALDLANVPTQTSLSLPRAGTRRSGDVVEVRVAVAQASGQSRDLQRTRILLREVLPHIHLAIGLIFARADTAHRAASVFQTAPAYSVLIKGWPVRNYRATDLFNFGFGLNLAALDFNHDDAQELGVGFVLSGFLEDLLQAGYGYNVKAGAPYAFFGLRLPLPDVGLARGGLKE